VLLRGGLVSFTRAMFTAVQGGATVLSAYLTARDVMAFANGNVALTPIAQMDDSGNAAANEDFIDAPEDGLASRTRLGNGLLTAGDPPFGGQLTVATSLSGQAHTPISASGIQGTATVDDVVAAVLAPNGTTAEYALERLGPSTFQGELNCLGAVGNYRISVYSRDRNGTLSEPLRTTLTQSANAPSTCATLDVLFRNGFE
jgi:hypothetical protein